MVLESILGDKLIKNDGTEAKLSTEKGAVVGIYFSAHWCPPCRGFTPKLSGVYNEIKAAGHDFEIVFISSDSDEESFKSYHGEMPWLAMPFDNKAKKDECNTKYEVEGIPTLVLLDASTGDTINSDGRSIIDTYGALGFPFTEARLEACAKEKAEIKAKALNELGSLSFFAPLSTIDDSETELDLTTATRSSEALAIAFFKGSGCQGSSLVLPKLIDIQETLGKGKLSTIIVSMEDLDEFDETMKSKMKGIPMVKFGEKSKEIVKKFETVVEEVDTPHVVVLQVTGTKEEPSFKIYADNAARNIYFLGAPAFPWSKEALDAIKAKEEALKEEMKAKQKNLEFLATGEQSLVVDKNGDTVSLATLQSKEVVGLYFSAHWCGPCRRFTPSLAELYKKCQEKGKSFEVVFISSDRDEEAFKEYYADMPWLALPFAQRDLKSALSEVFGVEGIPTLVLLKGNGDMISDEGRDAVQHGVDYFPWGKEDLAKVQE